MGSAMGEGSSFEAGSTTWDPSRSTAAWAMAMLAAKRSKARLGLIAATALDVRKE